MMGPRCTLLFAVELSARARRVAVTQLSQRLRSTVLNLGIRSCGLQPIMSIGAAHDANLAAMSRGYALQADVSLRAFNTFGVEGRAAWLVTVQDAEALPAALAEIHASRTCRSSASATAAMCCSSATFRVSYFDRRRLASRCFGMTARSGAYARRPRSAGMDSSIGALRKDSPGSRTSRSSLAASVRHRSRTSAPMERRSTSSSRRSRPGIAAPGARSRLARDDCGFTYRDSRFKREVDRWIVTALELRLPRRREPRLDYPGVRTELGPTAGNEPSPAEIAAAIRRIRAAQAPGSGRDRQRRQLLQESRRADGRRAMR